MEYGYAFLTPEAGHAYVILRVNDIPAAARTLRAQNVTLLDEADILR